MLHCAIHQDGGYGSRGLICIYEQAWPHTLTTFRKRSEVHQISLTDQIHAYFNGTYAPAEPSNSAYSKHTHKMFRTHG